MTMTLKASLSLLCKMILLTIYMSFVIYFIELRARDSIKPT
jgi:hypothetical protein